MVYFILMKLNISNIVHIINWQTQPLYLKLETNNKQLNFSQYCNWLHVNQFYSRQSGCKDICLVTCALGPTVSYQTDTWHSLTLGYHFSLPSSTKCMEDNFNFCNYVHKKYPFRSVNCLHMIYIIFQHNQVNKQEVRDETAVIYEAYIPHDSLQNNTPAHRIHQIFTTLALLYQSYLHKDQHGKWTCTVWAASKNILPDLLV